MGTLACRSFHAPVLVAVVLLLSPALASSERPETATVEFTSAPPRADIEVDGVFIGQTPSTVSVPIGSHSVKIVRQGYEPWTRTLQVLSGTVSLRAELTKSVPGSVATRVSKHTARPEIPSNSPSVDVPTSSPAPAPTAERPFDATRVEALIAKGKLDLAQGELRRAIVADPNSAKAWLLSGDLWQARGQSSEALSYYAQAAVLSPQDPEVDERYASALLAAKDYSNALDRSLRARDAGIRSEGNLRTIAAAEYATRNYAAADQAAMELLRGKPKDAFSLNIRAGVAYHTGRSDWTAIAREVAAADARFYWGTISEAIDWARAGQFETAATYFDDAIATDPQDSGAYVVGAAVLTDSKRIPAAILLVEEGLKHSPDKKDLLMLGVYACLRSGERTHAQRLLAEFERIGTGTADFLKSACLYHYRVADGQALAFCGRAVELDPKDYKAHLNYAWAAFDAGKIQLASEEWTTANSLAVGSDLPWPALVDLAWGVILREYHAGNKKGAREGYRWLAEYSRAVHRGPSSSGLRQMPLIYSEASLASIEAVSSALR